MPEIRLVYIVVVKVKAIMDKRLGVICLFTLFNDSNNVDKSYHASVTFAIIFTGV